MSKSTAALPDWELVLSAAARLQQLLPDAVLVGGTASAVHAEHRFSRDADHVLDNSSLAPFPFSNHGLAGDAIIPRQSDT
jgi:hypothetical protein